MEYLQDTMLWKILWKSINRYFCKPIDKKAAKAPLCHPTDMDCHNFSVNILHKKQVICPQR